MDRNYYSSGREEIVSNAVVPTIRSPRQFTHNCGYYETRQVNQNTPISLDDIKHYFAVLVKRKWQILLMALIGLVLSGIYALLCTPVFRSYATLVIEEESKRALHITPVLPTLEKDYFTTQISILRNMVIAQKLVEKMNLEAHPEFVPSNNFPWSVVNDLMAYIAKLQGADTRPELIDPEMVENEKKTKLVEEVIKRLSVDSQGKSRLVSVAMDAQDPKTATELLKNYLSIYLEYNLSRRRAESLESSAWLQSELKQVSQELMKSRSALIEFINKHGMVSLEKNNHVITAFNTAAEGLLKSKESRVRLQAFERQGSIGETQTVPGGVDVQHLVKLKETLALLESEYAHLRTVYSPNYPKTYAMGRRIEEMRKKIAEIESSTISVAVEAAIQEETLLQDNFEKAKRAAMALNSLDVQYAILQKEVDTNERVYLMFLQKAKEMQVNAGVTGNNVSVILAPVTPVVPVKPQKLKFLLFGALAGMMIGILRVVIKEYKDQSIRNFEDLRNNTTVPGLGIVPDVKQLDDYSSMKAPEFAAHMWPRSALHDAFRNIFTSIELTSMARERVKTIAFTSAGPEEGKTFVAVSIATIVSQDRERVLIVDCDLRRPKIHKVFGVNQNNKGLTNLLSGRVNDIDYVVTPTFLPNLNMISSGPIPENPVGLLQSERLAEVLLQIREKYDTIILDCPPILGFADSRLLTMNADGVVLVVKEAQVSRHVLNEAVHSLSRAHIIGAILNMANPKSAQHSSYFQMRYYVPG